MCGIAGIITPNAESYKENLQNMTNAIAHRGPDAAHHEFYENAALGHRRLSIVDLSETGKQPMFSNNKNECIVLNGEIYGFQELRKKYADYPYRGTSDTEVILAMYQKKGKDLVNELPGMFAFAIWDEKKQELFCARDRFGEKPFFYAFGKNGEFIFASEIKAILRSGLISSEINNEALSHFLQYGYVSSQQSIFKNIHILPPAHTLTYNKGKIDTKRYYKIPEKDRQISIGEAKEEFELLLKNAVKKQLVADVEVGSFLSGGLDSSTIVAMVSGFLPQQTTISFGYDHEGSELKYAKEIADKYHTHHIEIHEKKSDLAEDIIKISKFFDEPFSDMSYIPQFRISEAAAKHLKVILAGDVGDELFGGYHFYSFEYQMLKHFSYQNSLAKAGLSLYGKLKETSFLSKQNLKYRNILDFHQNKVRNYLSRNEIQSLGIQENYSQSYSFTPNPNSLNDIMRIDLERYVPGNMMVKSDRMAMANSLEVRTPFLDKEFAEFCIQLPANLKLDGKTDKIILRETMSKYWTKNIQTRHKQGFGSSVKNWFKEKSLQDLSDQILKDSSQNIFQLVDFRSTQQLLNSDEKHWNMLQLGIWAKNYL